MHAFPKGPEKAGIQPVVGIHEQHVFPARSGKPRVARGRKPLVLGMLAASHAGARGGQRAAKGRRRAVGRGVFHQHHLERRASVLREHAFERLFQKGRHVVAGHYHAEERSGLFPFSETGHQRFAFRRAKTLAFVRFTHDMNELSARTRRTLPHR